MSELYYIFNFFASNTHGYSIEGIDPALNARA